MIDEKKIKFDQKECFFLLRSGFGAFLEEDFFLDIQFYLAEAFFICA